MKNVIEGRGIKTAGLRIAIVASKFNSSFTEKLLKAAHTRLVEQGVPDESILVVKVPGAFEIPMVVRRLAKTGDYDAIIAIGAVIRGETYHYELVCDQAAAGIQQVTMKTGVPVIFGVITTENEEQAEDRSGGKEGNKGTDAADAALEMISVLRQLD